MKWLLKKIVGTKNERDLKKMRPLVDRINQWEEEYQKLSDEELKAKTPEFQKRIVDGETVDDLLCEAFAVVKNACRRLSGTTADICGQTLTWEMVPFDVQLIGGIAMHKGMIAEMQTGEGKTLVATLPVYLNALTGRNVHVVTVNDYLARRDAHWMGQVYRYLGLTVGCIQNQMHPSERREQYGQDITYGTNSEFGFDYLRDMGMAMSPEEMVQRDYYFAVIDEIDSILIDEARTPLIISGPAPVSTHQYGELKPMIDKLVRKQRDLCGDIMKKAHQALDAGDEDTAGRLIYQVMNGMPKNKQLMHLLEEPANRKIFERVDNMMLTDMHKEEARALREELYFNIDEKGHDANLTELGCETLAPNNPDMYVLPDLVGSLSMLDGDDSIEDKERYEKKQKLQDEFTKRSERIHNVDQLIRAYAVYERDVQYVVQDSKVHIVDENTGRLMPGRRWSDGLHQAIEAKEGVTIERETQTLATITIQNYFRMYDKLAGMTGTAETEADEFHEIYKLDVCVIPTNRPCRRADYNDSIYKTQREKFNAIMAEVKECHARKQPVLLGTASVSTSEVLSRMLRRNNIPHSVLNAKNHEREAEIVTRAGQPGAVTIATNMAGRGTDIKLGEGVVGFDRKFIVESGVALDDTMPDGSMTLRKLIVEKPCGLHVIASERHESRRIDRQLRGRCARQGDPGSSHFYVSLEDDLMRLFGSDRVSNIMSRLGLEEGDVMEHKMLNRSIGRAQRQVEQHNFSIRKRTLEYDDVMNKQREIVYDFRRDIVSSETPRKQLFETINEVLMDRVEELAETSDENAETEVHRFLGWVNTAFPVGLREEDVTPLRKDIDKLAELITERVRAAYDLKVAVEDEKGLPFLERYLMLQAIDTHWQEYLRNMDALRQGVGLRAYGQRDPLVEYKHEAYSMFGDLMDRIHNEIVHGMFRSTTSMDAMQNFLRNLPQLQDNRAAVEAGAGQITENSAGPKKAPSKPTRNDAALNQALKDAKTPVRPAVPTGVGRNDPCPCGSGKKFKKCCGANS